MNKKEDNVLLTTKGSHKTNPFLARDHADVNRRDANLRYFVDPLLRLTIEYGMTDEILWKVNQDGLFRAYLMCSDLFYWGAADTEEILITDIPFLERAYKDCKAVDPLTMYWGGWLYCSRKRKQRPQGAAYSHIDTMVWDLFNEAGPERRVDAVNPYEIGDYHPNMDKIEEALPTSAQETLSTSTQEDG